MFRSRPSPRPPFSRDSLRPGLWSRTCGRPGPRWFRDGSSTHSYSSASEIFLLRKRNKSTNCSRYFLTRPQELVRFPRRKLKFAFTSVIASGVYGNGEFIICLLISITSLVVEWVTLTGQVRLFSIFPKQFVIFSHKSDYCKV